MTRIRVSDQVESFVKALAPAPKKALRAGIKGLADGSGDIKPLEAPLEGWHRLRVQNFRVIYREFFESGVRIVDCVYANRRSVVYELFQELLRNRLLGSD
jgi:mRNA-degrading endonuclease RelE of RelBE toxin-antitoxin system